MNTLFSSLINQIKSGAKDPAIILNELQNGGQSRQMLEQEYAKYFPFMNPVERKNQIQNYLATAGIQDFQKVLQGLGTWTTPNGASYSYNNGLVRNSTQVNQSITTGAGTTSSTSYSGPSIVDYLSSIGQPTDFTSRQKLAQQLGILNYTGTSEQNTTLLNSLRNQSQSNNPNQTSNPDALALSRQMADLVSTADGYVSKTTNQIYSTEQVATMVANNVAPALVKSGVTVNPEVLKLTSFEDFMTQAAETIDPYYKSQFDQMKNLVSTKISQLNEDLTKKTGELQRTSAENVRTGRETLAERGLTFSGQRGAFETKSQDELLRNLDLANTSVFRSGQDLLTQAEGQVGTSNLQGINTNIGGRSLSFGNVTGTLPYQKYSDIYNRAQTMSADENRRRQYTWNLQNTSF